MKDKAIKRNRQKKTKKRAIFSPQIALFMFIERPPLLSLVILNPAKKEADLECLEAERKRRQRALTVSTSECDSGESPLTGH